MRKTFPAVPFPRKNLWFFFGLFCLANGLLAYFNLSPTGEKGLWVFGLVVPGAVAAWFYSRPSSRVRPVFEEEFLPSVPPWFFLLLLLAAAFFRFIDLTRLSQWPLTDEAKSGYFSMQFAAQGKIRLLYDFSQLPPFYIWLQGLFFRVFGVSLDSLWALPALLSLLAAAASYPAARVFFSRSLSLAFFFLAAFSFWPLYVGRFSHPGCLLLLWEWLVLWLLAAFLKSPGGPRAPRAALGLGLLTGAGFYTFTSWPSLALVATLSLLGSCWAGRWGIPGEKHPRTSRASEGYAHPPTGSGRWKPFFLFLGGMVLVLLPLAGAWLSQGYGGYIRHVWMFNLKEPWLPQLAWAFRDVGAFFWKSRLPSNLFAYKPFWGGYLNPLLGALCFIGALEMARLRSHPLARFWFLALPVLYLPGFLTGGVEMFRVLPLLPFLLAGAAVGAAVLLSALPAARRPLVGVLLLLVSVGLDSHHLFGVYGSVWSHPGDNWFASKSLDRLRAYSILKKAAEKEGPGIILTRLVPDLYDQSLPLATDGFNAEENGGAVQARWAALLINVHYQPYLQKEVPGGRWFWLAPDIDQPQGGLLLGLFPLPSAHPDVLRRWVRADRAMAGLVAPTFDFRDYKSRRPILQKLGELYPLFQGDRFLEACYWEKIAENNYGDLDYAAQIHALREAIVKGLPAAHLYNGLGSLYFRRHHLREARQAFGEALRCQPNHTSAAAGLEMLEKMEKTGQLPED